MKTTKPCLCGHFDSGKSSFHKVLFRLTLMEHCATISKEKVFGLSMITSDTLVVFVDEMSKELLPADQAKIFLQGGVLTVARKHADAQIV